MQNQRINISIRINVLLRWIGIVCIIIFIIYGLRGGAYGTVDRVWGYTSLHGLMAFYAKEGKLNGGDEDSFDAYFHADEVQIDQQIQFFMDRDFMYCLGGFDDSNEPCFFIQIPSVKPEVSPGNYQFLWPRKQDTGMITLVHGGETRHYAIYFLELETTEAGSIIYPEVRLESKK